MFLDNETLLASAHSATAATGSNISTNVLDTGPLATGAVRNLGAGEQLILNILCTTTATSTDSATVDFRFVTDSAAGITTPVTLASTGAIAKATLVSGYKTTIHIPNNTGYSRYVGVNAQVGVTILTAGTFKYWISKAAQDNYAPPAAYTLDA